MAKLMSVPQIDKDNTAKEKKCIKRSTVKKFRKLARQMLDDAPTKYLFSWHY